MESFKLNIPALIAQVVHHNLQVFRLANVSGHHCVVVTVKQQFTQQLPNKQKFCTINIREIELATS